jgi:hypothetical protein
VDQDFDTMQRPDAPDAVAPDGSDVRVLLRLGRGSMAHFELGAGRVSRAVAHRAVDEIWYILSGRARCGGARRNGRRPSRCAPVPACPFPRARISSSVPPATVRWLRSA